MQTDGRTFKISDLNPQFRNISFGAIENLSWSNRYGALSSGHLIYPVNYEPGRSYPLVIAAYNRFEDSFICDTKWLTTAFPPQPLAAAGFLVLLANAPDPHKEPTGFPGSLGEAYNWIAMIVSAIDTLVSRGLACGFFLIP